MCFVSLYVAIPLKRSWARGMIADRSSSWNGSFEHLIYSCDCGSIKPELSIYRNCLELLKAAPQDILHLDDRAENVEAAARLGNSVLFDTVEKDCIKSRKPIRHPCPKSAPGSDGIRLCSKRSLQQVRVSVSLIFLIHGLIIATWASRIPAFQAQFHLSPAVLGRLLIMAVNRFRSRHACRWMAH
jgi:hypothetical protein